MDAVDLASRVVAWGARLVSGGAAPAARSLVDTAPLERLLARTLKPGDDGTLPGIADNLARHQIEAVALTASSYSTGQSVTWVQGGGSRAVWLTPRGRSVQCKLCVGHVMASSSLPFFFPAVEVDGAWYGDGGVRLTAPLSPAIHLGARRIIIVSTRYPRSIDEAARPVITGYPPPAQVAGLLFNAIFLDLLDADALRLQQVNTLIDRLPPDSRQGLRHIDLLVLRPSQDLGRLANAFEADLPRGFRFMVRGLGSRETRSNDMLSLLMFQPDYMARLMELGEQDANAHAKEIEALLASSPSACEVPSSGS